MNGTTSSGSVAGPPIYVSPPYFCLCDESLAEAVEGLPVCDDEGDPLAHQTFIDIEPITGIPMRGRLRIQVSSEITTQARLALEPKMSRNSGNRSAIIPIFWSEEELHGTNQDVSNFRDHVYG